MRKLAFTKSDLVKILKTYRFKNMKHKITNDEAKDLANFVLTAMCDGLFSKSRLAIAQIGSLHVLRGNRTGNLRIRYRSSALVKRRLKEKQETRCQ